MAVPAAAKGPRQRPSWRACARPFERQMVVEAGGAAGPWGSLARCRPTLQDEMMHRADPVRPFPGPAYRLLTQWPSVLRAAGTGRAPGTFAGARPQSPVQAWDDVNPFRGLAERLWLGVGGCRPPPFSIPPPPPPVPTGRLRLAQLVVIESSAPACLCSAARRRAFKAVGNRLPRVCWAPDTPTAPTPTPGPGTGERYK